MVTEMEQKEMNSKMEKLKAEIFDYMRQAEYLINLKNQKINELNILEDKIRQETAKVAETAKVDSNVRV